jgi:hypothetical protein
LRHTEDLMHYKSIVQVTRTENLMNCKPGYQMRRRWLDVLKTVDQVGLNEDLTYYISVYYVRNNDHLSLYKPEIRVRKTEDLT